MALEMQDLMALKSMGNEGGMTPYEQYMVGYKQSKRPSGVAIAGLTVASVAAAAGVTAWIFGGTYANAKAKEAKEAAQSAKELSMAYYAGVDKRLDNIGALLESEVNRRIQGDVNITDVAGHQRGELRDGNRLQPDHLRPPDGTLQPRRAARVHLLGTAAMRMPRMRMQRLRATGEALTASPIFLSSP